MKPLYVILGILLLIVLVGGCSYNGMNSAKLEVDNNWAKVQSAYQRRADLIPNLVATVKAAAKFEQETYTQVAQARAGTLKSLTQVPADSLTPQRMADIQRASSEALASSRNLINVAFERYPDLKATQNFSELQAQLEGTENRIKTERDRFNDAVQQYNMKVTSFPGNLMAGIFGFHRKDMFQADPEAQKAPQVGKDNQF